MNVMINGGAGFLGQTVARELLKSDDSVVLYDLARPPSAELLADPRVTAVRGDVTDGLAMLRTAKEHGIDVIVHLAALLLAECNRDPGLGIRVSCGGMVNTLETARILGLKRVVWASSGAVFGGIVDGSLIANDSPFVPTTIYGATKILNEQVAAYYTTAHGLDTIGFRFSLMTGPGAQGEVSGAIGRELIRKPATGEPGHVPYGDDTGCWLWIEDAAEAVAKAVHFAVRTKTRVFNIGGPMVSLRDAGKIVQRLIPGAQLTYAPGTVGLNHRMDTSALASELGFKATTSVEDQLKTMIELARSGSF